MLFEKRRVLAPFTPDILDPSIRLELHCNHLNSDNTKRSRHNIDIRYHISPCQWDGLRLQYCRTNGNKWLPTHSPTNAVVKMCYMYHPVLLVCDRPSVYIY